MSLTMRWWWEIQQKLSAGPVNVEIGSVSSMNEEAARPAVGSIIAIRGAFCRAKINRSR
jgi:hypothetical protein